MPADRRPFTIADALILTAATAVAVAWVRDLPGSLLAFWPAREKGT